METTSEKKVQMRGDDGGSFVWLLGTVGAAVYYIQNADTFLAGVLGVLKALVWPAMLAYYGLKALGA